LETELQGEDFPKIVLLESPLKERVDKTKRLEGLGANLLNLAKL